VGGGPPPPPRAPAPPRPPPHDRVSRLELAIRDELPQVRDIHSHIEPIAAPVAPGSEAGQDDGERVRAQIDAAVRECSELGGYNRLHVRSLPDGYDVVIHCLADPDMPVGDAHHLADDLEKRLQTQIPEIRRVLVHVEPEVED